MQVILWEGKDMQNSFDQFWNELITTLKPDTEISNWTAFNGYLGDTMEIVEVKEKMIVVESPNAKNLQRISKRDVEKIWQIWPAYLAGKVQRQEIRDLTRHSKYIISILHWCDKVE